MLDPARLEAFLAEQVQGPVRVTGLQRLAGGASRENWAFEAEVQGGLDAGRHALVLRRDLSGDSLPEVLSREQEFRVLTAVHRAGVLVPRPRWLCADPAILGAPFFVMDRVEGQAIGRRVVRTPALAEARRRLPAQMGEQLALVHRIDPAAAGLGFLSAPEPAHSPAQTAVDRTARQLGELDEPHPVLELAARWLRAHAPPCAASVLVHGDFRIGNLLVGPEGLRGVLDWELVHVGDPAEDLGWPCVRSWRFGQDTLRLGGVGEPEEFFTAYERAGGRAADRRAVAYWEILGNFRWAVGCIAQADRHLSGRTPGVEFASLGRRTGEMELELLDAIERWEAGA